MNTVAPATIATADTPIVVNGKTYTDHNNATHEFVRWAFSFYDPAMCNYTAKQIADRYFQETGRKVSYQLVSRNMDWQMVNGVIYKCE